MNDDAANVDNLSENAMTTNVTENPVILADVNSTVAASSEVAPEPSKPVDSNAEEIAKIIVGGGQIAVEFDPEFEETKKRTRVPGKGNSFSHTYLRGRDTYKYPRAKYALIDTPEGKKKLTIREFKKLRFMLETRRNQAVMHCQHKLDANRDPRSNCQYCWFAFFNAHGELVQSLEAGFQAHGGELIVKIRGRKFYRNFLRFLGTVAQWKAAVDAQAAQQKVAAGEQESNVESTGSVVVNSGEGSSDNGNGSDGSSREAAEGSGVEAAL